MKKKESVFAFMLTFVSGILIHLYIMTNKVFCYNEMNLLSIPSAIISEKALVEGRWSLGFFASILGDNYSMPVVSGIAGMLMLGVAVVMIIHLLDVHNRIEIGLIAFGMVVFPAIPSFFGFTLLGDAWFFASFLAVLAVWLTYRYKYGFLVAMVVIAVTTGIHQSFFAVSVSFAFVYVFWHVFCHDEICKTKEICRLIFPYLAMLAMGLVLYVLISKAVVFCFDIKLTDYYGISEMTSITLRGFCKGFVYCYVYFYRYFFTDRYYTSIVSVVINWGLLFFSLNVIAVRVVKLFREKKIFCAIMIVGLTFLIPVGTLSLPLLMLDRVGSGVDRYMMYSLTGAITILVLLFGKWFRSDNKMKKILSYVAVVGVVINFASDYIMDNQAYARIDSVTTATENYLNRMVYRMEDMDEWNPEVPVLFSECSDLFTDYYDLDISQNFIDPKEIRGTAYEPHYSADAIAHYMQVVLKFPVRQVEDSEVISSIQDSPEYAAMSVYPADGSMRIIDDVLVVKFR